MVSVSRTRFTSLLPLFALLTLTIACGERAAEDEEAMPETQEAAAAAAFEVTDIVPDVRTPESVQPGPDGRYYVSEIGEFGADGDGGIRVSQPEPLEFTTLADGLNDPKGITFVGDQLYVTDRDRIVQVTPDGTTSELVTSEDFPEPPKFLNDLATSPDGAIYVSETGDFETTDGAVYRVGTDGAVETVITHEDSPEIVSPNGLAFDAQGDLWIVDLHTGKLMKLMDGQPAVMAEGLGGGDGLEFAPDGTLYATDVGGGRLLRIRFGAEGPDVEEVAQVQRAADLGLDSRRSVVLIPQLEQNTITLLRLP